MIWKGFEQIVTQNFQSADAKVRQNEIGRWFWDCGEMLEIN